VQEPDYNMSSPIEPSLHSSSSRKRAFSQGSLIGLTGLPVYVPPRIVFLRL